MVYHDVVWFDVPVHYAHTVTVVKRLKEEIIIPKNIVETSFCFNNSFNIYNFYNIDQDPRSYSYSKKMILKTTLNLEN